MTKFLTVQEDVQKEKKETVFTHILNTGRGFEQTSVKTSDFDVVAYLGNCEVDGDFFACYREDIIEICKGIKGDEFNQ